MARRAAKVDANQSELVELMRKLGASVEITSAVHSGFPDTVVGIGNVTVLVEIKDGDKVPSKRKLTPDQVVFHARYQGALTIIETEDQAIELVARMREAAQLLHGMDWNVGAVASTIK